MINNSTPNKDCCNQDSITGGDNKIQPAAEMANEEKIQQFFSIMDNLGEISEKFDKHIDDLPINLLSGCVELEFEKAISKPIFSAIYAQLCRRVSSRYMSQENDEEQSATFENLLITMCKKELTKYWGGRKRRETKFKVDFEKETDPAKMELMKSNNDEAERSIRQRAVGTVVLIGDLYKMEMFSLRTMNQFIMSLFSYSDEDSLECLCKLLTTIGKQMELENPKCLVKYFAKLNDVVVKNTIPAYSCVSSIQNVIELRRNKWKSQLSHRGENEHNKKQVSN
jgi:translation initiation factor 4G